MKKARKKQKKMIKKLCPNCKKPRLEMYAGLITGSYVCKNCGYIGPLYIEEDVRMTKIRKNKKK